MAEGGEFAIDQPELDKEIDFDDSDEEQEVNTNKPDAESTNIYDDGEEFEMQMFQHEQSGLQDTSYDETPLLGGRTQSVQERAWGGIKRAVSKKLINKS